LARLDRPQMLERLKIPHSVDSPQYRSAQTSQDTKRGGDVVLGKVGDKSGLTRGPIAQIGDSVFIQARLLSRSITVIYDDKLRPFGVTTAQFVLLSLISRRPITRADVARLQHVERSTLTRNLKTIFAKGWVEEVRDRADGRIKPLALTAAGKELLLNTQPEWLAAQAKAKALLGNDGIMAIANIADRLAKQTVFQI
jgi:DNA-binding MarR family transcriptional regulator